MIDYTTSRRSSTSSVNAIFKSIAIVKGIDRRGLASADRVIEGEYRTGHQEHLYIEPNGVIAVPETER